MACEITRPSPQVLFDRTKNMFSTTVLRGAQVIPESNEWYVVSLNYAVEEELYAFSEQQWKENDPRYACCENLVKLAARDGVFLRAATFAQGYIQINGTPGANVPESLEVIIGSQTYVTEGTLQTPIPAEGYIHARVRSLEAGAQTGTTPSTGQITTTNPGIDQEVEVFGGFCGGADAETCEQFRSRYLRRKQFAPRATAAWIEEKLLEWPCVTRICIRGGSCCVLSGTGGCDCGAALAYYVFMDNTFECGIPPQCIIDQIQEWMFGPEGQEGFGLGQVEIGVCGKIYPTHAAAINMTISDYGCITNAQKNEIRTRMGEFIKTLCPSVELIVNQFSAVVGSVLGFENPYTVTLEPGLGSDVSPIGPDGCGLELNCDAVACLGEITFIDTVPDSGVC